MAECHTFKVDNLKGAPDRLIRDFISECEVKMGYVRVSLSTLVTTTAVLLTVVVVKADEVDEVENGNRRPESRSQVGSRGI